MESQIEARGCKQNHDEDLEHEACEVEDGFCVYLSGVVDWMALCGGDETHDGADEEGRGAVDEHHDLGSEATVAKFLDWGGRGEGAKDGEEDEGEDAEPEVPGGAEEEQVFGYLCAGCGGDEEGGS